MAKRINDYSKQSDIGIINPNNIEDIATKYAEDVVSGKIFAFWQIKAICQYHLDLLRQVKNKERTDIRYNLYELEKVSKFFKNCTHYKTHIGKPFIPEPFQYFILAAIYAWERFSPESNRWVFKHTEVFVMMGKKGGKSTFASGLVAYDCLYGEPSGAEVYIGAATEEQAKIVWNSTKAFIDRNPKLAVAFTTINSNIYANGTSRTSYIRPFGRDSQKEGLNPYRVIIDEIHTHPDSEVYTTLTDGMVGRQKKGCVIITTAGNDIYSFCHKLQDRYEAILKGTFTADDVFPIIYACPNDIDISDEKNWYGANPSLGTIKSLESMQREYNKALQIGTLSEFRYKNLCQWTDDKESWIEIDKWNKLARPDTIIPDGADCYLGLDLAQVNDLCALSIIFPKQTDLQYNFLKTYFWIPSKTAQSKQLSDKIPFKEWSEAGYVALSKEAIIRLSYVAEFIVGLTSRYNIKAIFYDRAMSREVEAILSDNGLTAEPSFQGFGLSKDIKAFENLIALKEIYHDGNPCMTWNISNAAIKINDKQEKMLVKPAGYRKIDGCISTVEAVGAFTVYENGLFNKKNIRQDKGFRHTV